MQPMSIDKSRMPRDERRAQLLAAALEVFTAAGYHSDRKSTRLNSSHTDISRMPSSA